MSHLKDNHDLNKISLGSKIDSKSFIQSKSPFNPANLESSENSSNPIKKISLKNKKKKESECFYKLSQFNQLNKANNYTSLLFENNSKHKNPKRPNSVISRSFHNHLELAEKVKAVKKPSNSPLIEKLIKKSLKKAKAHKLSIENDKKHSNQTLDILRNEMNYHNNQIRLQNLLKNKKRQHRKLNLSEINLNQPKNLKKAKSLCLKPNKKCIRSRSLQYPHKNSKKKSLSFQKNLKKPSKFQENPQKDAKIPENNYYNPDIHSSYYKKLNKVNSNNLSLSSINFDSDPLIDKLLIDEKRSDRTFSFIEETWIDRNHNSSIFSENFIEDRIKIYEIKPEVLEKQNQAARVIQASYRSYKEEKNRLKPFKFSIETNTLSCVPTKLKPKNLNTIKCDQTSIINKISRTLCIQTTESSICSIIPTTKQSKTLSIVNLRTVSLQNTRKSDENNLELELQDQISTNHAFTHLITELKASEKSMISQYSDYISSELETELLSKTEAKYKSINEYIQSMLSPNTSNILERLSIESQLKFISKTHQKKQGFDTILKNASGAKPQRLSLNTQESKKISKNSGKESAGIRYSKEDTMTEDILIDSILSEHKDVESNSKQVECNIIKEKHHNNFPQVPLFNLMVHPVEFLVSDPRKYTTLDCVLQFIDTVMLKIDPEALLKILGTPLENNPLVELDKIQDFQIGFARESERFVFPEVFDIQKTLEDSFPDNINEGEVQKAEKIHRKMLLDVLNYSLQQFRPHGYKGLPLIWNPTNLITKKHTYTEIKQKVLNDFENWCKSYIGKIEELDYLESEDFEDDADKIKIIENHLSSLISLEYMTEDEKWTDYNFEETQTKLDLADMALDHLTEEIIKLINHFDP